MNWLIFNCSALILKEVKTFRILMVLRAPSDVFILHYNPDSDKIIVLEASQ